MLRRYMYHSNTEMRLCLGSVLAAELPAGLAVLAWQRSVNRTMACAATGRLCQPCYDCKASDDTVSFGGLQEHAGAHSGGIALHL